MKWSSYISALRGICRLILVFSFVTVIFVQNSEIQINTKLLIRKFLVQSNSTQCIFVTHNRFEGRENAPVVEPAERQAMNSSLLLKRCKRRVRSDQRRNYIGDNYIR